jgi:CRP/FNR family transcriptional regulator
MVSDDSRAEPPSWLKLHARGLLGVATTHADRTVISRRGERADVAWLHTQGQLEVFQSSVDGRGYLARILVAPTVICLKECLAGEANFLQTVRVLDSAELVAVSRARVLTVLESHPSLCLSTLVEVSRAFCGSVKLESNRLHSTESLLANVLLAYTTACGERWDGVVRMRVKRTQADLAEAIGANERSVNRLLTTWKEQGLIDKRDARYMVLQPEKLAAFIEEGSAVLVHHSRAT